MIYFVIFRIQWVPGEISSAVKRPDREADHSPQRSVEVKNGGGIPPLSGMSSWHSAYLIKHKDIALYDV
jgi:hypothetical protein